MTGELATANQEIARLIEIATRPDSSFWQTVGRLLEGKLKVERRELADALSTLRAAFDWCSQTGHYYSAIEFKGAVAEAFAGLGQFDAALDAVDDAVSAGEPDAEVWYLPELLRIKSEVQLAQAADQSASAAEDCFDQAGEMAREQGALFWELRIALSVARLRGHAETRRRSQRNPTVSLRAVHRRLCHDGSADCSRQARRAGGCAR